MSRKIFPASPNEPNRSRLNVVRRVRDMAQSLQTEMLTRFSKGIALVSSTLMAWNAAIQAGFEKIKKLAHIASMQFRLWLFKARLLIGKKAQVALSVIAKWSATLIGLAIAIGFSLFVESSTDLKASEVHLTAAQVIGAALALILSLSIIPAQRAAEAFSPAILRLYARDRALLGAFLLLVVTTAVSVLLGANILRSVPKLSIEIEFILLGVSFDALRWFYSRVLELLVPQTAIRLVLKECQHYQTNTTRTVEGLVRIMDKVAGASDRPAASRALLYSSSQLSDGLRSWVSQLDEFAHKLVGRGDTNAARDVISALAKIGTQYADARRSSVVMLPDYENILGGGTSDISQVLNPIYESIRVLGEHAAKSSNEPIVLHCIKTFGALVSHALNIEHSGTGGWRSFPFAYAPCFYLDSAVKTATAAKMGDALLEAVSRLQAILTSLPQDGDTSVIEKTALDTLFGIAGSSYANAGGVWGFPAIKASLIASKHDISLGSYDHRSSLHYVLERLHYFGPPEVVMEKAGKRVLQVFPAYDMGFDASLPFLLQDTAAKVNARLNHVDPFSEFLEVAEDIQRHYRELANVDFQNTLLRKWVLDSLVACIRVHIALYSKPPEGTEAHIDGIDDRMRWFMSTTPAYYPPSAEFDSHQAREACGALAKIGIECLENVWLIEAARSCGSAIATIASNCVSQKVDPYGLADIQEQLEVLARAADALGNTSMATELRAKIVRPANVGDDQWSFYEEARTIRWRQLDEKITRFREERIGLPNDSVPQLCRVIARRRAEQRGA